MTQILPLGTRRSRWLFDWSAAACLAAPEQSLNAVTGQIATFSRASIKTAFDANGVVRIVPHSLPAFHWTLDPVSGLMKPGVLLEDTRANLFTAPEDFTNAAWVKTNVTVTPNALAAPNGTLTADKLAATATAGTLLTQTATATATSHTLSVDVHKGSGATDARDFLIWNNTTSATLAQASLNYDTGVLTVTAGSGTVTAKPGGWYRVTLTATSGITIGNSLIGYVCFASGTYTAGVYAYAWAAQFEPGANASSYSPIATRSADALSWQFKALPQAISIYVQFVELGTLSTGASTGLVGIGASTNAAFFVFNDGAGHYDALHRTATDVSSILAASPTLGQSVEIRAALSSAGAVTIGQSIAGAVETLGATSAANALAAAWFDTTLTANERGGALGFISLQRLRVAAAGPSLATLRQG